MRTTRRLVQLGFLALTVVGVFVVQGHAERWCPFGGVEALYTYMTAGNMTCSLGVSNFYILAAVLLTALLVRRAFCGYVCPLGTISEWVQVAARRLGLRAWRVPGPLDRSLGFLKYAVLGVVLYFTWRIGELVLRGYDPCYVLISRHGEDISVWAYIISGVLLIASVRILVPLCRWLCPLAAVLAPFSRFGLTRVSRDPQPCADCGLCSRACPMGIPVDQVTQVTAARCTSCLECVAACPPKTRALRWGPPRWLGPSWPPGALVLVLLACMGGAVAASYAFPLASFVHTRGTPTAPTEAVVLRVQGAKCRHSSEQFVEYLARDDEYRIRGYLRIEIWPTPTVSSVRITFEPSQTGVARLKQAITEPYFNAAERHWTRSPYRVEGYDPWGDAAP